MIAAFDWSKVSPGGPVFDQKKLEAFNGDDLRAATPGKFVEMVRAQILGSDRLERIAPLVQERINRLDDFVPYASFFFGGELDYTSVLDRFQVKNRGAPGSDKRCA
jgi:glutamyl-tRNA synthetase